MPALPALMLIYGALSAGLAIATLACDREEDGHIGLYALLLGSWGLVAASYGMLGIGTFHWAFVSTLGLILAVFAHWAAPQANRKVLTLVWAEITSWSWVARASTLLTALVCLLFSVRSVSDVPVGWDASSYHLVHAARWVRDGAFVREHHPDAWSYYEYYPTGGDVLWSLFMLGDGTSDYLFIGVVFGHILAFSGVYGLFKMGGLTSSVAALGTAAIISTTPYLLIAPRLNTDGISLGLACACTAAALAVCRRPSTLGAWAVAAGVACVISVKTSLLPLLALLPLVLAKLIHQRGWRTADLVVLLLPLMLLTPEWVRNLVEFGSPLYPFGMPLLGGGEPMLAATMQGSLSREQIGLQEGPTLREVLIAGVMISTPAGSLTHFNLPALSFMAPIAAVEVLRLLRRSPAVACALLLLLICGTSMFVLPSSWGIVVLWSHSVARLILPAWAVVLLLSCRVLSTKGATCLLALVTLMHLSLSTRMLLNDPRPVVFTLALLALIVAVAWSPLRTQALAWLAAATVAGLGLQALSSSMERLPSPIVDDEWNAVTGYLPRYQPIREKLLEAEAATIATDFQYNPTYLGHDALRYLLMGRRAQHRLITISRWRSGELHPQWRSQPDDDPLDREAWRGRLFSSQAEWLYVQGSDNPTWAWAADDEALELVATTSGFNALYRLRPARAGAAPDSTKPSHGLSDSAMLRTQSRADL
ncbi:MAG: hypothetical protein EA397_20260 [Deltaproteobacteria bacterium]|nr:MAG: hypothetical protein EA397_20260 [Deltaproteobacteria bacterium]